MQALTLKVEEMPRPRAPLGNRTMGGETPWLFFLCLIHFSLYLAAALKRSQFRLPPFWRSYAARKLEDSDAQFKGTRRRRFLAHQVLWIYGKALGI